MGGWGGRGEEGNRGLRKGEGGIEGTVEEREVLSSLTLVVVSYSLASWEKKEGRWVEGRGDGWKGGRVGQRKCNNCGHLVGSVGEEEREDRVGRDRREGKEGGRRGSRGKWDGGKT